MSGDPEPSRRATLVVVDSSGTPLGTLGPIGASRHLQDTTDLIKHASAAGLEVTILRLLQAPEPAREDGVIECLYLAEASGRVPPNRLSRLPDSYSLDDQPLRLPYARPGGVALDLHWADEALLRGGRRAIGRAAQERTWNLSCVHRLTLLDGSTAWLKVVPSFFAHEGAMLKFMNESAVTTRVPALIGRDPANGRILLDHVDGRLMWGASRSRWLAVIDAYVSTQVKLQGYTSEVRARGAPDWRNGPFLENAIRLATRADVRDTLTSSTLDDLDKLIDALPSLLAALAACGLPATLVHGDLHPGNVLASPEGPVVLDWGDASVGHPLFDLPAFCHGMYETDHAAIEERVVAAWQPALPGADVAHAAAIVRPLAALWKALVYRNFLDHIEPSERHYHEGDVPHWLTEAVGLADGR